MGRETGSSMRRHWWRSALTLCGLLAMLGFGLAGCAVPLLGQASISGRVTGMGLAQRQAGKTVAIPLRAMVRCNNTSAQTQPNGSFTLVLPVAAQYTCTVTGPKGYAQATATIAGTPSSDYTLTFDSASATTCAATGKGNAIDCPLLALVPGTLSGTVMTGHTPLGNTQVTCEDIHSQSFHSGVMPPVYAAMSGTNGSFTIDSLPVSTYGCVARSTHGTSAYAQVAIAPAGTATARFSLCASGCQHATFHSGEVMHSQNVYLIYWLPSGYRLDPSGNTTFEQTIASYFRSVGGTPLYGMLSQYFDYQGKIGNKVTLAGADVDTHAFSHCASASAPCTHAAASVSDPLYDDDIQAEITRVMAAKGWKAGPANIFFVLLPTNAQECDHQGAGASCTYLQHDAAVCGYHSAYGSTSTPDIIYAVIPDANTTPSACVYAVENAGGSTAPNGNWALDAEISTISHEQFEAATDPIVDGASGGWYVDSGSSQQNGDDEIADICQDTFPMPNRAGANVILHGHGYFLQAEWSNAARACVLP